MRRLSIILSIIVLLLGCSTSKQEIEVGPPEWYSDQRIQLADSMLIIHTSASSSFEETALEKARIMTHIQIIDEIRRQLDQVEKRFDQEQFNSLEYAADDDFDWVKKECEPKNPQEIASSIKISKTEVRLVTDEEEHIAYVESKFPTNVFKKLVVDCLSNDEELFVKIKSSKAYTQFMNDAFF